MEMRRCLMQVRAVCDEGCVSIHASVCTDLARNRRARRSQSPKARATAKAKPQTEEQLPPKLRKRWIGSRAVSLKEENAKEREESVQDSGQREKKPPDPGTGDERMDVDQVEGVTGACRVHF